MKVKVPVFMAQHPAESLMAAFLLLGLLFISADGTSPVPAQKPPQFAAEKN
jgi:hypothetical protein